MLNNEEIMELMKILNERRGTPYQFESTGQRSNNNQSGGGGNMNQYQKIMDMMNSGGSASAPNISQGTYGGYSDGISYDFSTIAGGEGSSWWSGISDWFSGLGSSGGGGGSESSLGSSAGTIGYILAAIVAQMALSNNTDTVIEGQESGHWFSGLDKGSWDPAPANDPWVAYMHDAFGWEPTAGEKFDAAFRNEDWGTSLKRLPAAADYYADPIRSWLGYSTWSNIIGEDWAALTDPIGWVVNQIEDWF